MHRAVKLQALCVDSCILIWMVKRFMFNRKYSLLKWSVFNKNKATTGKNKFNPNSQKSTNQHRYTKRSSFHRGYYIENTSGESDKWKARVNGEFISGSLDLIKKSIDWWCDTGKVLPPESFTPASLPKPENKRKIIVHNGVKLFNDTGESDDWYVLYRGRLLKGTKEEIEMFIDRIKKIISKKVKIIT